MTEVELEKVAEKLLLEYWRELEPQVLEWYNWEKAGDDSRKAWIKVAKLAYEIYN